MIVRCRHCRQYYWRWNRIHPPRHFCSVACHDKRDRDPRETPADALLQIVAHRLKAHGTSSLTEWFECEECERLEGNHVEAIAAWMPAPRGEEAFPPWPEKTKAKAKGA
jgi:hypothetical protein